VALRNEKTEDFRPPTLVSFLLLLGLVGGLSLWMIGPFVLSLVMGGVLALLTRPFFLWLRARSIPPTISSALVCVCTVLLVIVPLGLFASLAVKQGIAVAQAFSGSETYSLQELINLLGSLKIIAVLDLSPQDVNAKVHEWISGAGQTATAILLGAVGNLPGIALQIALAVISCFFFLLDGGNLIAWLKKRVFLDEDVQHKVARSFNDMAVASIWAMLATGAAQSTVILIGFLLLGVPGAFLAASATFIFAWVPMLGCVPIWISGAVYLFLHGQIEKTVAMVAVGLFAGVIDNIIRPIVLKGRSDMHPLVSLVSIFGGIGLFGITGVFLGPIVIAVLISLLQIWPAVAERFGLAKTDELIK
jgi:predicted PurR-regulated permease PerM